MKMNKMCGKWILTLALSLILIFSFISIVSAQPMILGNNDIIVEGKTSEAVLIYKYCLTHPNDPKCRSIFGGGVVVIIDDGDDRVHFDTWCRAYGTELRYKFVANTQEVQSILLQGDPEGAMRAARYNQGGIALRVCGNDPKINIIGGEKSVYKNACKGNPGSLYLTLGNVVLDRNCRPNEFCQRGSCVVKEDDDDDDDDDGTQTCRDLGSEVHITKSTGEVVKSIDTCSGRYLNDYYCKGNAVALNRLNCRGGCVNNGYSSVPGFPSGRCLPYSSCREDGRNSVTGNYAYVNYVSDDGNRREQDSCLNDKQMKDWYCPSGTSPPAWKPVDCSVKCIKVNNIERCNTQCEDRLKNGQETDLDCGGNKCSRCNLGKKCKISLDCNTNLFCSQDKICAKPTCSDGEKNQGELGIDCGGPCDNQCERKFLESVLRSEKRSESEQEKTQVTIEGEATKNKLVFAMNVGTLSNLNCLKKASKKGFLKDAVKNGDIQVQIGKKKTSTVLDVLITTVNVFDDRIEDKFEVTCVLDSFGNEKCTRRLLGSKKLSSTLVSSKKQREATSANSIISLALDNTPASIIADMVSTYGNVKEPVQDKGRSNVLTLGSTVKKGVGECRDPIVCCQIGEGDSVAYAEGISSKKCAAEKGTPFPLASAGPDVSPCARTPKCCEVKEGSSKINGKTKDTVWTMRDLKCPQEGFTEFEGKGMCPKSKSEKCCAFANGAKRWLEVDECPETTSHVPQYTSRASCEKVDIITEVARCCEGGGQKVWTIGNCAEGMTAVPISKQECRKDEPECCRDSEDSLFWSTDRCPEGSSSVPDKTTPAQCKDEKKEAACCENEAGFRTWNEDGCAVGSTKVDVPQSQCRKIITTSWRCCGDGAKGRIWTDEKCPEHPTHQEILVGVPVTECHDQKKDAKCYEKRHDNGIARVWTEEGNEPTGFVISDITTGAECRSKKDAACCESGGGFRAWGSNGCPENTVTLKGVSENECQTVTNTYKCCENPGGDRLLRAGPSNRDVCADNGETHIKGATAAECVSKKTAQCCETTHDKGISRKWVEDECPVGSKESETIASVAECVDQNDPACCKYENEHISWNKDGCQAGVETLDLPRAECGRTTETARCCEQGSERQWVVNKDCPPDWRIAAGVTADQCKNKKVGLCCEAKSKDGVSRQWTIVDGSDKAKSCPTGLVLSTTATSIETCVTEENPACCRAENGRKFWAPKGCRGAPKVPGANSPDECTITTKVLRCCEVVAGDLKGNRHKVTRACSPETEVLVTGPEALACKNKIDEKEDKGCCVNKEDIKVIISPSTTEKICVANPKGAFYAGGCPTIDKKRDPCEINPDACITVPPKQKVCCEITNNQVTTTSKTGGNTAFQKFVKPEFAPICDGLGGKARLDLDVGSGCRTQKLLSLSFGDVTVSKKNGEAELIKTSGGNYAAVIKSSRMENFLLRFAKRIPLIGGGIASAVNAIAN